MQRNVSIPAETSSVILFCIRGSFLIERKDAPKTPSVGLKLLVPDRFFFRDDDDIKRMVRYLMTIITPGCQK